MATFVAFLMVRLPMEYWLRQRYQAPVTHLLDPTVNFARGPSNIPTPAGSRDWVLTAALTDKTGHYLPSGVPDARGPQRLLARDGAVAWL